MVTDPLEAQEVEVQQHLLEVQQLNLPLLLADLEIKVEMEMEMMALIDLVLAAEVLVLQGKILHQIAKVELAVLV